MAIKKYPNTAAGKAEAEAVPDPKYILEGPRITVFTGADIPLLMPPQTRRQLYLHFISCTPVLLLSAKPD